MKNIIQESEVISKCLEKIKLPEKLRRIALKHIMTIIIASFSLGYKGKTVNFEKYSPCHRTTIAHFLNEGKWKESVLEKQIKTEVLAVIYGESIASGKPIYCMTDDTILSKTKPLSQAVHPIEDAYFHQSHLKRKQDYGHQAVSAMLSCNGVTLCYAVEMYDKSKSKIQIVAGIADELPEAPAASYFLCDSWYTSKKLINAFLAKGFYTVGAIRTNHVIYPCNVKKRITEFALVMRETDPDICLVTVGKRQYYIYRYEGSLNGIDDAVVRISYPKDAFGNAKALRAFICTDTSLTTDEILDSYAQRWHIEVFFRQCKNTLAFGKYQIRCAVGIKRFWLIMSLVHFLCCVGTGTHLSFFYQCGVDNIPFNDVLAFVA